ncbi:MAG: PDZ domain-containing protein [Thermodesulfobacteriota bacterium]
MGLFQNRTAIFLFAAICCLLMAQTVSCAQEQTGGVGVNVAQLHDEKASGGRGPLVVLDVLDQSPARSMGVLTGDIIVEIDGKPTEGRAFDDLVKNAMLGPAGSKVTLTIKRARTQETISLTLTRAAISQ